MTKLEKYVLMQLIEKIKEAENVLGEDFQSDPKTIKAYDLITEASNICDIFTESK